ncbi:MAG: tripartite tricarboxylate transporter substrate binding protein [Betaproteobacteria bacterium]|nr:tripartite tricarboxylate transporter substrate binding protein [Betaproteobacteria bacterium]
MTPQPRRSIVRRRKLLAFLALLLAGTAIGWTAALAQGGAYPSKPVKVVIPGGAGSGPDTLTRIIASKLADLWGQPVVAENIVGAGGNIGHERVAKAQGDGYTLLLGMIGPMAINPTLQEGKLGFDPLKDLVPITMVSRYPNILVVHPSVPVRNLQEFMAYAKANPGKLRYGTPGTGTTPHLSAVMFSSMAGITMLEVPYKSSAQMTTDVIAGHIDLMFLNPAAVLPHVRSGVVRAIAVTSNARAPYAPELPTMIESGLPGYEVTSWYGMFAPAGTPKPVVAKINADMRKVMALPEVHEQFISRGDEPSAGTSEQAGNFVKSEIAKWNKVIKQANIKVE